jgi:hypothetical protein
MVFIFRHPCAVVHSRLEGVRLGMMSRYRQGWLECNEKPCKDFGFAPDQVRAMEDYEFFALRWLVLSQEYYELARTSKAATTVVYEDLCRDPLGVARSVFASLGWPMLPATERFIRRSTSPGLRARLSTTLRGKLSYYGLYKDPVETAQSWQKRLPAEQQRRILAIARPFSAMDWWGEGPVRNRPSRGPDGPPGAVEEARSPLSMLRT